MTSARVDNWQPSRRHRQVRDRVAEAFGIEPYVVMGRGRRASVVWPRHTALWVVRECFPGLSYPMIGKLFGGRDHSSVIYGVDKVKYRRERDPAYAALTDAMVAELSKAEPSFVLDDEMRETVERVCERLVVKPSVPSKTVPFDRLRTVLPKNDFAEDDHDGESRARASDALAAAIAREGVVCR